MTPILESTQEKAGLDRLLRPRSLAVFGGWEAAETIRQCRRLGYDGVIWPVHPSKETVEGLRCYRSVDELPAAPDAAFVGVNRSLTIDIVRALAARGAGGAVCYASGFKEAGDDAGNGAQLQQSLVQAAGAMPILGPNCYGFINYLDGALLWPDQHGGERVERGVAILTQSSNIAINLTMQKRGLPISYMLTAGNQAQMGLSALASGALDDPRVTALGLHIEGIDDIAAFEAMLRKARAKNIPVAVLKLGKSETARQLTLSHTASLAGSDALSEAFFRRLGAARLQSIPEFLETLKLLHVHGPLLGADICSMSCSGGEASIMADAAERRAVSFRPLRDEERQRVKATLNELVAVANPLDYHTFIWGDENALTATFTAMLAGGFDLSMLVLDLPRQDRCCTDDWDMPLEAIKLASRATGGPAAVVASMPENLPEAVAVSLVADGVAPMMGIDEALAAVEAAALIGRAYAGAPPAPLCLAGAGAEALAVEQAAESAVRVIDEAQAKARLREFGLRTPEARLACTAQEAASAAAEIGFPVVLKAVGAHLTHKTELGAVKLNLGDRQSVLAAAESMTPLGGRFLVERMVEGAVAELILGVNRDPQFGLHLVIGAGGVLVELMKDSRVLLLPTSAQEIREAILSLRSAPLLSGFRGKPPADIDAAIEAALAVARFAQANADSLLELDVNPLMLCAKGQGAFVADALMRVTGGGKNV